MSLYGFQFKKDFNELEPEKKDYAWADRLITQFRNFMEPLVDEQRARVNRSYLLGKQDMAKYRKKFVKPEEMPFDFMPLGIFEKTRDILTAERQKAGIYLQLNALDPTAQEERDYDKKLLENASFIESVLTYAQVSMGLPPYQIDKDKEVDGEKIAKGNISSFKELGLDANSPEDIAFFFQTHYRLDIEMDAEAAVNHFVLANELAEYISDWADDILAIKAIAGRAFANEITHAPDYKYILPENIRWIKGQRRDGKDAKAIMSVENITVAEFLAKAGSEITPDNVTQIIESVNFYNGTKYDGLSFSTGAVSTPGCTNAVNYDSFLNMKIGACYIEWKTIDVDTTKVGLNSLGNYKAWTMPYEWKPAPDNDAYKKEQVWAVTTYKAHFITLSSSTQRLFKFGKLFDQVTYGPEDEYSSFSFQLYKQPGQSAVEVAIPFIDNIHDAWFRFCWILNKAKPKGTRYNYNVIAKIASKMTKEENGKNDVLKVIKMFQDSIDDFYVNDSLNPNVGGGQNPHFDKPNGLDETITKLYQVIKDQQEQISDKLGINAIREAYSPNPNDGYKLQMQTLAQSRNATEYLSRMIMSTLMNFAKHTLSIVSDMIEFKGKSYSVIEKAIGFRAVDRLRSLKKVPLHKYGIFVESFNTDVERQQLKQEAQDAWQKGEISYHVYILVKSIDNFKKAAQILAYEKGKDIERKKQEQERIHQQKLEEIQAASQGEQARIAAEKDMKMSVQQLTNQGLVEVAHINNDADYQIKKQSIDAEPMKAGVRAQAKIQADEAQARIKRGEPVATADV